MPLVWTPGFAIGIPEIDQQHQELFNRLAKLREGIVDGKRSEVARLVDFLGQSLMGHFEAEERWMVESRYPEYEAHKTEHRDFMQHYLRYTSKLDVRGPALFGGTRVDLWIADWLRNHILVSDKALGNYLAQKLS